MLGKIISWFIGLTLLGLFLLMLYVIMKAEQADIRKCRDAGMVYVKPFQEKAYCAQGKRLGDL